MRVIGMLGLALSLAVPAMAQDTSVVVRGVSRSGSGSADTTIIIRRRGQNDQVVHVTGKLSTELRANLERQLDESRRAMGNLSATSRMVEGQQVEARRALGSLRESNRVMESRQLDLARRQVEAAGELNNVMIARPTMRMDTLRVREMQRGAEVNARAARDFAGRSMQVFAAKPRIGITVDIRARDSDRYGAYVSAVTPGGPAAKAGIRTADIIIKLAGKSLTANDDTPREEGSSAPGLRLLQLAAGLEPGKRIELEYRRGNDNRKTSLLPADDDGWFYSIDDAPGGVAIAGRNGVAQGGTLTFRDGAPSSGRMTMLPRTGGVGGMVVPSEAPAEARFFENFARGATGNRVAMISAFGGPLADLELAPLNEKLGSYFGVTEGVLVIDVPEKASLGLIPGDVITAIDGRKVGTPSQLFRVLATYDKGEEFKIQVTRQRRSETIVSKQP
ncbi:MAG: PDZ domain-containing protein [Gemmatimonadales bacterium]